MFRLYFSHGFFTQSYMPSRHFNTEAARMAVHSDYFASCKCGITTAWNRRITSRHFDFGNYFWYHSPCDMCWPVDLKSLMQCYHDDQWHCLLLCSQKLNGWGSSLIIFSLHFVGRSSLILFYLIHLFNLNIDQIGISADC